ncbi:MAG: hypothetical protein SWO11_20575 [Thermodesulfobacteriota bacterium]|nr:hypothetical protein [Thermodesulfobacteriota bacterium]
MDLFENYKIIEGLNKEIKRRTKLMEIVVGENACYTLLVFYQLKDGIPFEIKPYWKSPYEPVPP